MKKLATILAFTMFLIGCSETNVSIEDTCETDNEVQVVTETQILIYECRGRKRGRKCVLAQ